MEQLRTGRGCCPATGEKCNWSYQGQPEYPDFLISYGSGQAMPGWKWVGEARSGGAMFIREQHAHPTQRMEEPLDQWFVGTRPQQGATSPELLHRVYSTLLQHCPMSTSHEASLRRRGLPLAQLHMRLPMASLPPPKQRPALAQSLFDELGLKREEILQVPGFFINKQGHLSIAGAPGLLIPAFDTKGRIAALQIRRDDTNKSKSRYQWLSSAGHHGASSGSPACFLGERSAQVISISEGVFKIASLLLFGLTHAAISIAGVGNISSAIEHLRELEHAEEIHLYYDTDWREKKGVLLGLSQMIQALEREGWKVKVMGWDPTWGKGIDDALAHGMTRDHLYEISTEGVLRATRPVSVGPHLQTDRLPLYRPPSEPIPTQEELYQQTETLIQDALSRPPETFISVAAPTGTGKTHCTNLYAKPWTVRLFANYKVLEETESEMRQIHGPGEVRILYGRMAPPANPTDFRAQIRYQRAGCPFYEQMKKRTERGHSACAGCPLAPDPKNPNKETCAYWRQRKDTLQNPTPYLLSVPQAFVNNPDLLRLLPDGPNQNLFAQYQTLVIDDCQDLDGYLAREQRVTQKDVQQWKDHPLLAGSSHDEPEQLLLDWLTELGEVISHEGQNGQNGQKESRDLQKLRELSKGVCQIEEPVCEQEVVGEEGKSQEELPLCAVKTLSSWLARGGAIRMERSLQGQVSLWYLSPAAKLMERMKWMTVLNLDATADEAHLQSLAGALHMKFEAPPIQRRTPRFIQVADLLWSRDQLEQEKEVIEALLRYERAEGGAVLGFKEQEGENAPLTWLSEQIDGHWGCHERGTNALKGVLGLAMVGHYALPIEEARRIAFRRRTLAWYLGAASPDETVKQNPSCERTYNDPWRPWVRTMHTDGDALVEHIRRHHYTAGVVQGGNRPRNWDLMIFLLSGEPLDGLSWEVPVEVWTRAELRVFLGLPEKKGSTRQCNPTLTQANQHQHQQAQQRIEEAMPQTRQYMQQLGRMPTLRELRRFLGREGKLGSQKFACGVESRLHQEWEVLSLPQKTEQNILYTSDVEIRNRVETEGREGEQILSEIGVPPTELNKILRPLGGTPPSENFIEGILVSSVPSSLENELGPEPSCEEMVHPLDGVESGEGISLFKTDISQQGMRTQQETDGKETIACFRSVGRPDSLKQEECLPHPNPDYSSKWELMWSDLCLVFDNQKYSKDQTGGSQDDSMCRAISSSIRGAEQAR